MRRTTSAFLVSLALALTLAAQSQAPGGRFRVAVTYGADKSAAPLDGRLLLMISTDAAAEPRFQIVDGPNTQVAFGIDVENWKTGQEALFDAGVLGYPVNSLAAFRPATTRSRRCCTSTRRSAALTATR